MPQAIVDPEELRRFASDLKRLDRDLQGRMRQLRAQLDRLGKTWRDQEHKRFVREFEQTTRDLQRFIQAVEEYIPFLIRKAEPAEEYLRRR